jgi:hypothetical protein
MPITPLRVTDQSEEDLRTISEQPLDRLEEAYSRVAAIRDHAISPKVLRTALEALLAPSIARALTQQLVALRSYVDDTQATPSEAIEALSLGLKQSKSADTFYQKWDQASKVFERFLSLDNIITIAKALELSLDFEHILIDTKILIDVRFVYSADRNKIIGGIVCNRLRIKFHDEDGHKSLSISLDKDEIQYLQKQCADALKKIELASGLLKTTNLPSFVAGEEYNDFA